MPEPESVPTTDIPADAAVPAGEVPVDVAADVAALQRRATAVLTRLAPAVGELGVIFVEAGHELSLVLFGRAMSCL